MFSAFLVRCQCVLWIGTCLLVSGSILQAASLEIYSSASDGEHTENGSYINGGASRMRVGVGPENYGDGRNGVLPFELPNLGNVNNPFSSAVLQVFLESVTDVDGFKFNTDLYAFPPRPGVDLPVLGTLVYHESNAIDNTPGITHLQDNLISGGNGAAPGAYHTNATGSANLLNYLNAQYDGGAGAFDHVFLRLNPDLDNGEIVESYNIGTSEAVRLSMRPVLVLNAIPEPSSVVLTLFGLSAGIFSRRRKAISLQ